MRFPLVSSGKRGPSRIRMCAYNMRCGGGNNMNMALRAMAGMRIDLGFFFETKLPHSLFTHEAEGFSVVATQANSYSQGGVALFYRPNERSWSLEGIRGHGPNVISATLVTGRRRWTILGVYIPPSDDSGITLTSIGEAVRS